MVGQTESYMERAINDKKSLKVEFNQSLIILNYNAHNKMFISTIVCVKIETIPASASLAPSKLVHFTLLYIHYFQR